MWSTVMKPAFLSREFLTASSLVHIMTYKCNKYVLFIYMYYSILIDICRTFVLENKLILIYMYIWFI